MKYRLLIVLIPVFIVLVYKSSAQNLWEDLNFPQDVNSKISSFAIKGDEIYVGTEELGVFYTPNGGKNWQATDESIYQPKAYPVTAIIISPSGDVFAVAKDLYVSRDKGRQWNRIYYFSRNGLEISGIAINSKGYIYVNTGREIYESIDNGDNWTNITDNIGILNIYCFGISPSDYIYLSIRGEIDGFYRNSRDGWVRLTEGLPPSPKTDKFVFYGDRTVYANISNSIYYSENYGALWQKINRNFESIDHLGSDDEGNLVVHFSRKIYIYDKRNGKWLDDIDDLDVTDVKDVDVKDNYIIATKDKGLIKSKFKVSDIIKNYSIKWTITVVDNNNQPVRNKEFDLFRMRGNLSQGVGKITTDNNGMFTITSKDFAIGDGIKIERIVHAEPAVKLSHGDLGNIAYRIKIDNVKFGDLGAWQYDILDLQNITPTLKLDHTTILFRLLFSIEWDAKSVYMDSLCSYLRAMNNYLYDVSDGQMYIEKVAIYDKGSHWRRSDVQLHASNMVWPCANIGGIFASEGNHVYFPRKWWGNSDDTRNISAQSKWLNSENDYHWTSICHELGHYMMSFFDEYLYSDTIAGKYIPKSYNYGFMDYQYPNGGGWHSEMSNATRYPNKDYKITLQWYHKGSDCWRDIEKQFEKTFDGIPCPIIKPSERSNLGGLDYFRGPNDNMQINCDVGSLLDCQIFDYPSNAGDANVICYYYDSKGNLVPLPKTHIILQKSDKKIYQGQSADNGQILILGADVGDFGYMTYSDQLNFSSYILKFNINYISNNETNKNPLLLKDEEFTLKQISEPLTMVSNINYSDNQITFSHYTGSKAFNDLEIEYEQKEGGTKTQILRYNETNRSYICSFDENIEDEGLLLIKTQDKLNQEYIIPFQYTSVPYNRRVNSTDGNLVLHLEQESNTDIIDFLILSGNYLPIKSNLPNDAFLIGNVNSLTSKPNGKVNFRGNNFIRMSYSTYNIKDFDTSALKICLWNDSRNNWSILDSWIDTLHHEVGALLTTLGTYALFYIPQHTDIDFENEDNYGIKIIPNPSYGKVMIMLNLKKESNIEITFNDIFGRQLTTLWKGVANEGLNKYNFELESINEGIYFISVKTDKGVIVKKVSIVK